MEHVGDVSWVVADRPSVNAFAKLMTETLGAFDLLEKRSETRCIVLISAAQAQIEADPAQPTVHDVYR